MSLLSFDQTDFPALSLFDLLQARDLFHVHLMMKPNVIGTAVGRYLIREKDPYPSNHPDAKPFGASRKRKDSTRPKTLENSEVRRYSWPCVLVFVSHWRHPFEFRRGRYSTEDFVPPAIYLPDGRRVPICVVEASRIDASGAAPNDMAFPSKFIGGGYPVVARVQNEMHLASIGCMLTDGHKVYALTNRHVSGDIGETVYAIVDGHEIPIGKSSNKQISRVGFEEIYCGWPGREVFLHMDVGLIEIEDKTRWTAQVYGIGELGPIVDLSVRNLSLKLIGAGVRAYGCASRQMFGEIQALFYRYKSIGGFEYVSDFLIGPRHENGKGAASRKAETAPYRFITGPGDSGTIWVLDHDEHAPDERVVDKAVANNTFRPIAIQWGGQVFSGTHENQPFALATCLSTVCNRLDVEIVRDWNVGQPEYWGAVGHYAIAEKAIELLQKSSSGTLEKLLQANLQNITYKPEDIRIKELKGLKTRQFIPLADVPDYAWKRTKGRGGEGPNHFADMDKQNSSGVSLLDICTGAGGAVDPKKIDVQTWINYYESVGDPSKGLLPFRVWQIFDALQKFAERGDVRSFVCAAGVLSHYVGDACQPLHISALHHGDPSAVGKDGKPIAEGVHGAYEAQMVNRHTPELLASVSGTASGLPRFEPVTNGHDAAVRVVQLMRFTFVTIAPKDIVDAYSELLNDLPSEIADELWKRFANKTTQVMSAGTKLLSFLWQEAWRNGGKRNKITSTRMIDPNDLSDLYKDPDFLRSYTLKQIGAVLSSAGATQIGLRKGRLRRANRPRPITSAKRRKQSSRR